MNEDFLSYLWEFRKIPAGIKLADRQFVHIDYPGMRNHDSGPDFQAARIRMGPFLWVGNVEIHQRSSDWFRHGHQGNPNYENVVLHVVYDHDRDVYRENGERIPVLQLKGMFDEKLWLTYQGFLRSRKWLACSGMNPPEKFSLYLFYRRLFIERLEQKTDRILGLLDSLQGDWEALAYHWLIRYFGLKINNEAFGILLRNTPWKVVRKYVHDKDSMISLMAGQAGMLNDPLKYGFGDIHQNNYRYLSHKHHLKALPLHQWKFHRTRPSNFPSVRIRQMAEWLCESQGFSFLFDSAVDMDDKIFTDKLKNLPPGLRQIVSINGLLPVRFAFLKGVDNERAAELPDMLDQWPAEKNSILKRFQDLGWLCDTALHSQALLQLKSSLCDKKACLRCEVGMLHLEHSQ